MSTKLGKEACNVLIPDGQCWEAVKVARCLRPVKAFRPIFLSPTRQVPARFSRYCGQLVTYADLGAKDIETALLRAVDMFPVDVVLPATWRATSLVSVLRESLQQKARLVPMPSKRNLELANDKWALFEFCRDNGFPSIPTIKLADSLDPTELNPAINRIPFPALVKPAISDGGKGIVKVREPKDLLQMLATTRAQWKRRETLWLLQEFVPGTDLCLGVFCLEGKIVAYTLQRALLGGEQEFGPQRAMEFVEDESVLESARFLMDLLRWSGIAYIDFRLDERTGKPRLTEINPRFGQAVLGSLAAGVNFPVMACRAALKQDLGTFHYRPTRFIHPYAYLKALLGLRKRFQPPFRWRESGLCYALEDPIAELSFAWQVWGKSRAKTPQPLGVFFVEDLHTSS
jgi:predicted ATP-grasp superfamily ATP-dependent carboligase